VGQLEGYSILKSYSFTVKVLQSGGISDEAFVDGTSLLASALGVAGGALLPGAGAGEASADAFAAGGSWLRGSEDADGFVVQFTVPSTATTITAKVSLE
jgi:hypothetical protein